MLQTIYYTFFFYTITSTTTTTTITTAVIVVIIIIIVIIIFEEIFPFFVLMIICHIYLLHIHIYTHRDLICLYFYGTFHLRVYRTIIFECPFLICNKCNCLRLKITQIFCMYIEFIYVKVML